MFIYFETTDETSLCRGVQISRTGPETNRGPSAVGKGVNAEGVKPKDRKKGCPDGHGAPPVPDGSEAPDGASSPCRGSHY